MSGNYSGSAVLHFASVLTACGPLLLLLLLTYGPSVWNQILCLVYESPCLATILSAHTSSDDVCDTYYCAGLSTGRSWLPSLTVP